MIHDTIAVEDSPKRRPDDSISSERVRKQGNDPTESESFSASEAGGDDAEIGGLDSAGEEEDETEGELMDLS